MHAGQVTGGQLRREHRPEAMTFGQLAAVIMALDCGPRADVGPLPVDQAIPGSARRCRVIGIDGLSGSGKSGFARRLATELDAPVLSVDDLVPGWDAIAESVTLLTNWVLRPLAAGRPARWRRYDWAVGRPGEWADLDPGGVLIVEGCCVGLPPAADWFSYLIYIDAPERERRRRLESRPDWATYAPFAQRWARQENALQAGADTPGRADLVVDNSAVSETGNWADGFSAYRANSGARA
jgi:hypothetical protein